MATEKVTEPLDLRQFLEAADAAIDEENGFDLDDVVAVEEAWEQDDDEVVMHGFIVVLRGGDRLYVEYRTEDTGGEHEVELSIIPLEPGMERPDLSEERHGVYWYHPDHITTHLYTLRPKVKDDGEG